MWRLYVLFLLISTGLPALGKERRTVDICFLLDVTGSMSPHINDAVGFIENLVRTIELEYEKKNKPTTLRLGLVGYRDFADGEDHFERIPFTTSERSFRRQLARIKPNGGGKSAEDIFGGLEKVAKDMEWRHDSKSRVFVIMGDQPCHGRKYHNPGWRGNDEHPSGDPKGRSLESLLNKFKIQNILISFAIFNDELSTMIGEFEKAYGKKISVAKATVRKTPYTGGPETHEFPGGGGETGGGQESVGSVFGDNLVDLLLGEIEKSAKEIERAEEEEETDELGEWLG